MDFVDKTSASAPAVEWGKSYCPYSRAAAERSRPPPPDNAVKVHCVCPWNLLQPRITVPAGQARA